MKTKLKLITILSILVSVYFFYNGYVFSEDIVIKKNKFINELVFGVRSDAIESYFFANNVVHIKFKYSFDLNLKKPIKNDFIDAIVHQDKILLVKVNDNIDVFMKKDERGLRIIFAKIGEFDDLLLKSEIRPPILSESTGIDVDKIGEETLVNIDKKISEKNYASAINLINNFSHNNSSNFYGIEAYYKLGEIYLSMGEEDLRYYKLAYEVFDNFAGMYPSSYRYDDALLNSAESKFNSGKYMEALQSYMVIFEKDIDEEKSKKSLKRIAGIYEIIGQYDKSIEAYKEFLEKYNEDTLEISNKIGFLYTKFNDYSSAFEYFYDFIHSGVDLSEAEPVILLAIAETLVNKNLIDDAIKVYESVYNNYPAYINVDMVIYNAAQLLKNEGKDKKADALLLKAHNEYPDQKGGIFASLEYTEKYLMTQKTDYWEYFLRDVLSNSLNEDIEAQAIMLIVRSYSNLGNYDEALQNIKKLEKEYFNSSVIEDSGIIKQDILLKLAEKAINDKRYEEAEAYANDFMNEFPIGKTKKEVLKILDNINNGKLMNKRSNDIKNIRLRLDLLKDEPTYSGYNSLIDEIEAKVAEDKMEGDDPLTSILMEVYQDYMEYLGDKDKLIELSTVGEDLLILFPQSEHYMSIKNKLNQTIRDLIVLGVSKGNYLKVVSFFDNKKNWINNMEKDNSYYDINENVAYAFYKQGDLDKAKRVNINEEITHSPMSVLLNLVLHDKGVSDAEADIKGFSGKDIEFLISELGTEKPAVAYNILSFLNQDDNSTISLKYKIMKNTVHKQYRTNYIIDIYSVLKDKDEDLKKKYDDVFFSAGLIHYEDGNFKEVVKALREYETIADSSVNLPQTYYIMARSYMQTGYIKGAKEYFGKVIDRFPDSIYAAMAKNEIGRISS